MFTVFFYSRATGSVKTFVIAAVYIQGDLFVVQSRRMPVAGICRTGEIGRVWEISEQFFFSIGLRETTVPGKQHNPGAEKKQTQIVA